jgi:outer membrane protein OmpA-like peptidoglycan-associated protein
MNKIYLMGMISLLSSSTWAVNLTANSDEACAQANTLIEQVNQISQQDKNTPLVLDDLLQRSSALCPKNAYINAAYADFLIAQNKLKDAVDRYQAALKYKKVANISPEQQAAWQLQVLQAHLQLNNRFEATKALNQIRLLKQRGLTLSAESEQKLKQLDNQLSEDLVNNPLTSQELHQEYSAFNINRTRDFAVEAPKLQYRITFDSNQAQPNAASMKTLFQIAQTFNNVPLDKIIVIGHTDLVGNATYNQKLSERRAQAVANVLSTQYPALKSKLQIIGKGKSEPLYMDTSDESNRLNRRVEFVFIH